MGAGIAQVAAQTGHKVTLVDISQQVNLWTWLTFATLMLSRFWTRATLASRRASSVWPRKSLPRMPREVKSLSTGDSSLLEIFEITWKC